jgi:hypothetical protein
MEARVGQEHALHQVPEAPHLAHRQMLAGLPRPYAGLLVVVTGELMIFGFIAAGIWAALGGTAVGRLFVRKDPFAWEVLISNGKMAREYR